MSNPRRGWGGTAAVLRTIGCGLRNRGHRIRCLVRPDSAPAAALERDGFRVAPILRGYDFPIVAAARAAWFLNRVDADVLVSAPAKDLRLGGLGGKIAGRPVLALGVTRPDCAGIDAALWRWIPDHVVANSEHTRDAFLELDGMHDSRVSVIHNGTDLSAFEGPEPADLPFADGDFVVVFVGRIDPDKGIEHLVEAWPRVRDRLAHARLVIVGSGGLEDSLRRRTEGDRSVLWLGFRRDVPEILAACDVAVVPSPEEAFGLVAVEAMASGLPVVGTNSGGLPEVVRDGIEGRLVPPNRPRELGDVLIELAEHGDVRRKLGIRGLERAKEFSDHRMVAAYEATIRRVVREARGA